MENYFTKLPNNLFYCSEEEINLLKECNNDYKVLLVLDYLYTNTNRKNEAIFSIEDMIIQNGFKPDGHKNKTNDKFKDILQQLQELQIIKTDINLNKIKSKELIRCQLNLFEKDKEDKDIKFIQLFDTEKEKILAYKKEKIDNLKLLYYYCYLKSRMYKRKKDDDLVIYGGKAEVCYPSYKKINEDIGLTDVIIKKYNDILVSLDLIRIANAGLWYYEGDKNKTVKESCNIYTLCTKEEETWKLNLKEGIKFYKKLDINKGKIFTNNQKYKNNNKKVNGYIGRIEYLEIKGKATEKQIEKKNKLKQGLKVEEEIKEVITEEVAPEEFMNQKYLQDDYDWFEEVEKSMQKKEIMTEPPKIFGGFYAEVNKNRKAEEVF